ncbi:hypothetical protein AAZX31_03G083900 [Glycine max]|uniref:Chromo domain-containing protein n=3 Tax=Glycine subgen. Soja TaxID=1462606 RepID=I1JMC3_SOYBN|nr:chromo domain-containing protein LHP1 [Glycine max]XP_028224886.1 chromo domain-containing protein LHP1-like [Glycine soja]KAH1069254.1 hypothetical protein GYH30_006738 [Glycine max]KRH66256.1 hypothetical protein GLYMA_03G094200v4 [Glycine max]RZC19882.1 Chromo domain-containing protein LHP1 [Glycine soja]|eukprot:XP_006576661.1 chromo domain-containing protein LHP1 [Glycine max]
MKGGGGKRKAATSEAPNDVAAAAGGASVPSDGADLGVGDGVGVKVQNFEGNEGTQLRKTEEEKEEPNVEGDDEGEEEEDYAEGEEEYEEGENGGAAVAQGGRQGFPVLGENFFEVQAIRRKRVRKGQVQYLIKWNGWPETANTWEPPENLESVPDVVEAFEESLKSGKHRKRKRKHVVHHTQPKKRLERSTTPYSLRRFSTGTAENHTQSAPPLIDPSLPNIPAFPRTVLFSDDVGNGAEGSSLRKATPSNANRSANGSEPNIKRTEENDYDPVLSELKTMTANGNDTDRLAIRIPEAKGSGPSGSNDQMDAKSKGVSMETNASGRCRGSKRRKCGSVKRFKKELYANEPANTENPVGLPVSTAEPEQTRDAGSGGNTNHARPASNIVNIIKPVGYSASVASGTQDVLVTFVASKSDGTEVMVDNKYLKTFNPLLLINFYEQHLRYSPTL